MADAQQPFVSNPFSSFDPSQFSNAYSSFNAPGQIPAWPTQYRGRPTDAFGNPISSFDAAQQAAAAALAASTTPAAVPAATPGTTLNSTPSGQTIAQMINSMAYNKGPAQNINQASNATGNPMMNQLAGWQALTQPEMAARGATYGDPYLNAVAAGAQQPQAAAAPAAAPSGFNSYQSALDALSSPGPLKQYGATVPQATQPSSGVLQNFLANWQPQGGSGPGSGFTDAFNKALRGK